MACECCNYNLQNELDDLTRKVDSLKGDLYSLELKYEQLLDRLRDEESRRERDDMEITKTLGCVSESLVDAFNALR